MNIVARQVVAEEFENFKMNLLQVPILVDPHDSGDAGLLDLHIGRILVFLRYHHVNHLASPFIWNAMI